jgi:hypothetical protein
MSCALYLSSSSSAVGYSIRSRVLASRHAESCRTHAIPAAPGVAEEPHGEPGSGGVIVLGRTYLMTYTDGRGQAQTERGRLVTLDQQGFVVLEVNERHLLVPKARVDALIEVE